VAHLLFAQLFTHPLAGVTLSPFPMEIPLPVLAGVPVFPEFPEFPLFPELPEFPEFPLFPEFPEFPLVVGVVVGELGEVVGVVVGELGVVGGVVGTVAGNVVVEAGFEPDREMMATITPTMTIPAIAMTGIVFDPSLACNPLMRPRVEPASPAVPGRPGGGAGG
jgi:hypothetical protein